MSPVETEQVLESALQLHLAGRLSEAGQRYRQILVLQPDDPRATHLLGVIALQSGRYDLAIQLIRQSLTHNSDWPEAHNNLGVALNKIGQVDEAVTRHRRAIALNPSSSAAHCNLGIAFAAQGKLHDAIASYRDAIALKPDFADAHNNLGLALKEDAQFEQAIAAFRMAIALRPDQSEIHNNLGVALQADGQLDPAIAACRQAIILRPAFAQPYNNLGYALQEKDLYDDAVAAYRQAIALDPDFARAHNNLGNALRITGKIDEAIAACRKAVEIAPDDVDALGNLANALQDDGQFLTAIDFYRRAVALRPDDAQIHLNLAIALLHSESKEAWVEFEWRLQRKLNRSPFQKFDRPKWNGEPLESSAILLHTEQGFGDAIQFFRYVPMVQQRGGNVIIACSPKLQRLFHTSSTNCQIVPLDGAMPPFDFHSPLMSLPHILNTIPANPPNSVPYLFPDPQESQKWQSRLTHNSPILNVGLVWAGNTLPKVNRVRSMTLAHLAPLAQIPGIRFISLQKGAAAAQAANPPPGLHLVDWSADLNDFADTAALIANLDLVITIDTSVAHLAGAMGKPVWTLLPFVPDWRWLRDRDDSPWYPTMRLFRQSSWGDWDTVIPKVVQALSQCVGNPA